MDFLGGSLPNVMFIVGILAVGFGLGIELKLVPLSKEISRGGRIGAFLVGLSLIAASTVMYLNSALVPQQSTATAAMTAVPTPTLAAASVVDVLLNNTPEAQVVAPTMPAVAAPEAQVVAPTTPAVAAPASGISTPDLLGLDDKGAQLKLQEFGLKARQTDTCSGMDQGNTKIKKGRVRCQNPAAGETVAPGSTVEYVLMGK